MKVTVIPRKYEYIKEYEKIGADAFIFGLKNFSVNYELTLSLEEIKELLKVCDKEIFIAINKNIFNSELKSLKNILIELDKLNIKGVLFYDLSLLYLKKELNLKIDLVWNQTHMVTNYNTCNYYHNKGVEYAFLASEITLEEILEIKKKTNMKLMTYVIGYPIMSFSRRKLLTNYYKGNNKTNLTKKNYLMDKAGKYIIKETNDGTAILFDKILNGSSIIKDLKEVNMDYIVLNDDNICFDVFYEVLKEVKLLTNSENEESLEKIKSLIGDSTGFFFKKTIFKVK